MNFTNPSPFSLQLALMAEKAHRMSCEKGFYENPRSPLEIDALVHSEISEATEESRKGTPPIYQVAIHGIAGELLKIVTPDMPEWSASAKPEGRAVEYADAFIRICDHAQAQGWNLGAVVEMKMAYNALRSHKHGGKLY